MFNKAHGPSKHQELCELNNIYPQSLNLVPEKTELLKVFGWEETVREQKQRERDEAAKKGVT